MENAARTPFVIHREPVPPSIHDAFRQLHGSRLHGFTVLIALGDLELAARLTTEALAAAAQHADELRHPERAAAWLRARVVRSFPRRHQRPAPGDGPLSTERAVLAALGAVRIAERAALVASDVERLDLRDVETVAGRTGGALEKLLVRARARYARAYAALPVEADSVADAGAISNRIHTIADRAMA